MKKTTLIILLSILTFSCEEKNQAESLLGKIEKLQIENDSLKSIVKEINSKYVFDSISIRDIPSYKNTYKLNSIANGEIVFVGYNIGKKTNVIMVDSFSYNPKKLYNPDTLKLKNGGFRYKVVLKSDINTVRGILEVENKYGRKFEKTYMSTIRILKN